MRSNSSPAHFVKRGLDVVLAGLTLIIFAPVMLLASAMIYVWDRQPVLYRQRRVGRHKQEFDLLKFRSMRVNTLTTEQVGQVGSDHPLVTPVGRFIRRFKVDELPQLINVLRGQMSLVGPRPTVPEQASRYDAFENRRLVAAPGLTGWAQVNGNTELSWPQRIALDVWYIDRWSLGLDLLILVKTLGVVIHGERVNPHAVKEAMDHADRARGRSGEH